MCKHTIMTFVVASGLLLAAGPATAESRPAAALCGGQHRHISFNVSPPPYAQTWAMAPTAADGPTRASYRGVINQLRSCLEHNPSRTSKSGRPGMLGSPAVVELLEALGAGPVTCASDAQDEPRTQSWRAGIAPRPASASGPARGEQPVLDSASLREIVDAVLTGPAACRTTGGMAGKAADDMADDMAADTDYELAPAVGTPVWSDDPPRYSFLSDLGLSGLFDGLLND
ncbi:hypothetical protein [Nonomuraea sp. NPDC050783]|uniref:hypothetical protein n=1 Tax=Nonomuraea sp. NPDC050783 TaxID=3154634 RepID=UPI00346637C5